MNAIELVNTQSRLSEVVDHVSTARRVAVDTEANAFFKYHERICLVQLISAETAFLIDPFALDDIKPLGELLEDASIEKVIYAPHRDLRNFDREWGFHPRNLFDIRMASALVNPQGPAGLPALAKEHAGVELAKELKIQRSDWSIRPLNSEELKYAATDVFYLLQIREALWVQLKALTRLSWAKEEFERLENIRYTHPDPKLSFLSIKGSRELDGRGLAVLRSLFQFRERDAKRLDLPPFKVIANTALVKLASDPGASLTTVKGLGRYARRPASRELRTAIEKGLKSQPFTLTKKVPREEAQNTEDKETSKARLKNLKAWRRELAAELYLNPGVLWPAVSLERLARNPSRLEAELVSPEVRYWQVRDFADKLASHLESTS